MVGSITQRLPLQGDAPYLSHYVIVAHPKLFQMEVDIFLGPTNPLCLDITVYYVQNKWLDILDLKYMLMLSHFTISVDSNSILFPTAKLMVTSQTSLK